MERAVAYELAMDALDEGLYPVVLIEGECVRFCKLVPNPACFADDPALRELVAVCVARQLVEIKQRGPGV